MKNEPSIVDDFMYSTNVAGSAAQIKHGFLRKVYGILSAQLALTTVVSALIISFESVASFVQESAWLILLLFIGQLGLLFALMLKSQEVPTNYYLLAAFTLLESITVGVVVTFYEIHSVIEAALLTCAVTVGLTMYAMQTKHDYSPYLAAAVSFLWILIVAGFLQIFFQSELVDKAIAVSGALLFSLFIIIDTQIIMNKVSAEEYIHAAVLLYLDIINLFLHILRIIGDRKK